MVFWTSTILRLPYKLQVNLQIKKICKRACSGCGMKQLVVFLAPPGWHASPLQGYLQRYVPAGTHLNTWVERGTVRSRVKCLTQEHNTMPPARVRARTARSRVECPNHEATAVPTTYSYSFE